MNIHINDNQTEATINGVEYLLTPKETTVSKTYTIDQLKSEKIAVRCENREQAKVLIRALGCEGEVYVRDSQYPIEIIYRKSDDIGNDFGYSSGIPDFYVKNLGFTKTIPFSQVQFPEKRDWEITAVKAKDGTIIKYKDGVCYERSDCHSPKITWSLTDVLICGTFSIHSVLRSDGVEFTVGEEVEVNGHNGKIVKFERAFHNESKMNVCLSGYINDEDSWFNITELSKHKPSKKVLFKTEDGVEVFEGDHYWAVYPETWLVEEKVCRGANYTHLKRFSTYENALQYISDNKPEYSKKQYNELLEDLLEAFQQACWIESEKKYDHLEISTWKRIQRTLIEAGKIKAEECYRQV